MLRRDLLVGLALAGTIGAQPITSNPAALALPAADALTERAARLPRDVQAASLWARDVSHASYPTSTNAQLIETRSLDLGNMLDTVIGWIMSYMSSGSSSTHGNGTSAGAPTVSSRSVDYDDVINTVAGWAKDYVHTDNKAELAARGMDYEDMISNMALWTRGYFSTDDSSVEARAIDMNNVVDKFAGWAKDYFRPEDASHLAARGVDYNDVVDSLARWTKDYINGDESASVAARAVATDEIVNKVAGWAKDYFRTDTASGVAARSTSATDINGDIDLLAEQVRNYLKSSDTTSKLAARDLSSLLPLLQSGLQIIERGFGVASIGGLLNHFLG